MYGDDVVYLSGTNPSWVNYGFDFGNNLYNTTVADTWKSNLKYLGDNGVNAIRIWVHVIGENTPEFNSNGFCIGTDRMGTLVSDLRQFLDECQKNGMFMILTLWNAAADMRYFS